MKYFPISRTKKRSHFPVADDIWGDKVWVQTNLSSYQMIKAKAASIKQNSEYWQCWCWLCMWVWMLQIYGHLLLKNLTFMLNGGHQSPGITGGWELPAWRCCRRRVLCVCIDCAVAVLFFYFFFPSSNIEVWSLIRLGVCVGSFHLQQTEEPSPRGFRVSVCLCAWQL